MYSLKVKVIKCLSGVFEDGGKGDTEKLAASNLQNKKLRRRTEFKHPEFSGPVCILQLAS